MAVPLNEILQKKGSLHRTPPPRAPSNKPPPATRNNPIPNNNTEVNIAQLIPGVKLRKTGMRDSLIAEDVDNKHTADTDEPENELQSIIAKRRAMFDHKEEAEVVKPKKPPKPRPKPSVDNHKPGKENLQTKQRSGSTCSDSSGENKDIILTNKNRNVVCRDSRGDPKLCNLPTMESLGKAPTKPSKPDSLVKLLEKYESKSVIMAPRRSVLQSSSNTSMGDAIVEDNDDGEMYDDVDEIKNQILGGQEDEQGKQEANGIFEENYDDVGGMEENTGSNTQGQNPEPICDENYDDLDTVKEQALQIQNDFVGGHQSFIGGEELYDVLAAEEENRDGKNHGGHDTQIENNNTPPPLPSSSLPRKEKAKKDLKKEMENQKKKEKEELKKKKEDEKRREREEKEEKKRKEEEKKKRERVDKELCRKHKIKPGNENTGIGEAKSNFAGDGKFELPVKERDPLVVVSEKNCPQGKWLVQNTAGHYGYIPTELIQLKIDSDGNRMSAIITEDFYEDVDQYQKGGQIIEEEDDQEVYDDIGGQDPIDEELYEELPADQ